MFYSCGLQEVKSESEVAQSCPTLCNPKDRSLPGSSIHGIFQATVLEWGAPSTGSRALVFNKFLLQCCTVIKATFLPSTYCYIEYYQEEKKMMQILLPMHKNKI